MLIFNFHGGLLIILLLSVLIQVSISEKYRNFQCVSFQDCKTLSFKIIFKDIPDTIKNSPTLKEYPKLKNSFFSISSSFNKTYKVYENVTLTNTSLLYVELYYHNYKFPIWKPLIRSILQKNDVDIPVHRICSSIIEFDDWDLGDQKQNKLIRAVEPFLTEEIKNSNKPNFLEGLQTIYYTPGEQVIIEAVYIYNIPIEAHHVALLQSNNNVSVEGVGNGEVREQLHVFNKFNFTLWERYDGFKIFLRLNSSKNNRDAFRDIKLLHFIKSANRTTKHTCLDKCKIWYDLKPVNMQLSDLEASAVCPKVQTSLPRKDQRTTSETTEGTKTSIGLTTTKTEEAIKTDEGTTIITNEETTEKTNSETAVTLIDRKPYKLSFEETTIIPTIRTALNITDVKLIKIDTAKILAIVLPIVVIVLVILILAVIYWYRRDKVPKPETEDTYLYATQLNYVQLELESSDLYEAPKKDYVSVYTRVIGVLKPKSSK